LISGFFQANFTMPPPPLKREELEESPSRKSFSWEDEKRIRRDMTSIMIQSGILLELPILTIATACLYFHRFYSRVSMLQYDPLLTVQACLFLASKAEEHSRRLRDILNTTHRVQHISKDPLQVTQAFWNLKDNVLRHEQTLLRVLGYDLECQHAHRFLLHIVRQLEATEDLATMALYILNDSLCTTLGIQYPASTLACGAIYLASEVTGDKIIDFSYGYEWWEQFDVNQLEIEDICHQLIELYESYSHDFGRLLSPKTQSIPNYGIKMGGTSPVARKNKRSRSPSEYISPSMKSYSGTHSGSLSVSLPPTTPLPPTLAATTAISSYEISTPSYSLSSSSSSSTSSSSWSSSTTTSTSLSLLTSAYSSRHKSSRE